MVDIVLFHSILDLRAAEREIEAALEADGHKVSVPDLFGGWTAETYDDGFRLKGEIGDAAIGERAQAALAGVPGDAVLAGVSFGAFLIGRFWGERPAMKGALLIAGFAPWMTPRRSLPVSAHVARPDPFDEEAVFAEWAGEAGSVALSLHRYDSVGHSFLDRSLPDYDGAAAALCLARAKAFLRGIERAG